MTTVTPGAEPVAWMYEAIKPRPDNEQLFVQTNRANMDPRYWTETPLYATPPDALQTVVEAWLPIESAPKDGRGVLMIDVTASTPEASTAYFYEGKWWLLAEGDRSREDGDWAYSCPWYATPTHWQPLPKPPALSLAGGDV